MGVPMETTKALKHTKKFRWVRFGRSAAATEENRTDLNH
jgi:hypothetical protein